MTAQETEDELKSRNAFLRNLKARKFFVDFSGSRVPFTAENLARDAERYGILAVRFHKASLETPNNGGATLADNARRFARQAAHAALLSLEVE